MLKRITQPPIDPSSRDTERHDFWHGCILAVLGLALLVCGATHLTNVDTVKGDTAWEIQLVKAFSSGGLEYPKPAPLPDPATFKDPVAAAAAFEQWEREAAQRSRLKPRVNSGATTPCPT